MSRLPRITIITPSFNQADFLARTIESVVGQGYPDLEYFVIDGGSTDGSQDIIKRYEEQINWWTSEKDRGQTDAINKGLARATGEIIAYLNSDDLYLPGTLHHVAELFNQTPAPMWMVGGCTQVDPADEVIGQFDHHGPGNFADYLNRADGMLPQPSSFWSAELFEEHGPFRLDMHCSFDWEFNCRLMAHGRIPRVIDRPLAAFRVHPDSKGTNLHIQFGTERVRIMKMYCRYLPQSERRRTRRNAGYSTRAYAIRKAHMPGGPSLWKQVVAHPWWLGSQQIREALRDQSPLKGSLEKAA